MGWQEAAKGLLFAEPSFQPKQITTAPNHRQRTEQMPESGRILWLTSAVLLGKLMGLSGNCLERLNRTEGLVNNRDDWLSICVRVLEYMIPLDPSAVRQGDRLLSLTPSRMRKKLREVALVA